MRYFLFSAVAALAAAATCVTIMALPNRRPMVISSQGPTIERLEQLRHLATSRVYVSDVLTGESDGHRGAWLIKGDALLGVDLSRAQILEKNEAEKQAAIRLPEPEILQARVDHERAKTWEVRRTSWVPWTGDPDRLRDEVMREAQRLVAQVAASNENIGHAKMATEAILQAFYQEVGWQVRVTWTNAAGHPVTHDSK